MKEIYILATEQPEPLSIEVLREALETEDVKFLTETSDLLFSLHTGQCRLDVRFEARESELAWAPSLITGSESSQKAFRKSRGFYRFSFETAASQPSIAVFEALWCVRTLMEHVEAILLDVTAYKLHDAADVAEITELDFDIRDHINLHVVEVQEAEHPLWVHSHGMEKFGVRDVEAFHLTEEDLLAAESFLHELCTDLAFGQGPAARAMVETSEGQGFLLLPSEEARLSLMGMPMDTFDGHEGMFLTVVSADGRHTVGDLLKPYRERFDKETPEESEALKAQVDELLPPFKARFQRRGLMEPLTFLVRAPFESHPRGEQVLEDLWVEVMGWEDDSIIGRLVDGGSQTTEWRKGAHVEIEQSQVNAIALGREGRTLDEEEMHSFLLAELPA